VKFPYNVQLEYDTLVIVKLNISIPVDVYELFCGEIKVTLAMLVCPEDDEPLEVLILTVQFEFPQSKLLPLLTSTHLTFQTKLFADEMFFLNTLLPLETLFEVILAIQLPVKFPHKLQLAELGPLNV